jgi:hypothetical protein
MRTNRLSRWLVVGGLATVASMPAPAEACGGTFCDSGPNAMPVDQTGENVLFVMDGQIVEAHIQIQYQGTAAKFAWLIPLQALPEFEVGSQLLFNALLQSTVPSYGFSTQTDQCDQRNQRGFSNDESASGAGGSGGGSAGGPNVVMKEVVGAYDVTVLQGGTADEVSTWLSTNGYQSIPNAPAILQDYVQKGFLFAAIKLVGGADTNEIHPIVIRYQGDQPCVPLKLTAVAAVEDMGVRTFFLGDGRVVPSNYKHVTLNSVRIDWLGLGQNYSQVVSRAADSPVANGRAFVTEYAGPNTLSPVSVSNPSWNSSVFTSIDPVRVIDELGLQGLVQCFSGASCQYSHPLILPILQKYLPRPAGISEEQFYGCLSCYQAEIDTTAWNGPAFAQELEDRIVVPGRHAADLIAQNPYLTRMFTLISPAEMSLDPEFHERADLPDVALPALATRRVLCDGRSVFLLPDGRQVALPPNATAWPAFDETMPWASTVEEIPAEGDPIVLVDNRPKVVSELSQYNDEQGWPGEESSGCVCSVPRVSTGGAAVLLALAALSGIGAARRSASRKRS